MARIWKEKLDLNRHVDFMRGGYPPQPARDNLIVKWVYCVNVCSFTFQFHCLEDIRLYLKSQKKRPTVVKALKHALEAFDTL